MMLLEEEGKARRLLIETSSSLGSTTSLPNRM